MGKLILSTGFTVLILGCILIPTPRTEAYVTYQSTSTAGDNCTECHPGFDDGIPGPLHSAHLVCTSDCNACHITNSGATPVPTHLDPPVNGYVGCVGCHGRDPGTDAGDDWAAGLRLHHENAGAPPDSDGLFCSTCHLSDPTPVPEDISPLYYGTSITTQTDSCTDNLDNDGDLAYDGDDPNCTANTPPVADPNGPYSGTVGVAVSFDGSGSSDSDGTIVAYDWDFGDGNTGTGVSPTHTYAAAGNYTVTLTVTDDAGATDSATTTAMIDPAGIMEVEIEVPGAVNATNKGKTPIKIEFPDANGGAAVEIAELYCGGDVSDAGASPWKINGGDEEENEFTALFVTLDLMLVCDDTMMVCMGTLADGTVFMGMDDLRVVRDTDGRCRRWNGGKGKWQR